MAGKKIPCPQCHKWTAEDSAYCSWCGFTFPDEPESEWDGGDRKGKDRDAGPLRRSLVGTVAVALALTALGVGAAVGFLPWEPWAGDKGDTSAVGECGEKDAKKVDATITPSVDRFRDAQSRARSTSRIALSPVIGEMQEARREFEALDLPSCAEQAGSTQVRAMNLYIQAYIAFLGQEPDSYVSGLMTEALKAYLEAAVEWSTIHSIAMR